MKTQPKAFITYSHKNTDKREQFEIAIDVMEQNNEIKIWCDAKILAGDKWEKEIAEKLKESDVLLYLVSAYSLASKNCNKELMDILDESPHIQVIPIILEDCDFEFHALGGLEALPKKNGILTPVSNWNPHSRAWKNVVEGIRKKIASIPSKRSQGEPDTILSTPKGLQPDSHTLKQVAAEFYNRANFFLMLGNNDLAIAGYNKSIELNPDYAWAYNNRGVIYINKGEHDLAIVDFNKAIKLNPNLAAIYANRGTACSSKGEYDRAISDYNKAIELNPNLAAIYANRGVIYNEKGEHDIAIADHNKAIKLNPNLAEAYTNRGNSYSDKDEHDLAIADHNKAIELNSNYASAYNNRANAKAMSTSPDLKGAIADYNKAIELNPNFTSAYFNRANAKQRNQDIKGAREDLKIALPLAEQHGKKDIADLARKIINNFAELEK